MAKRWNNNLTQQQQLMLAASRCNQNWFAEKRAFAAASQKAALPHPYVERVILDESPAFEFVVPDFFAPCTNAMKRMNRAFYANVKAMCKRAYLLQAFPPKVPLPGRPTVLFTRFTSAEPDAFSDWAKVPLDCLIVRKEQVLKNGETRVYDGVGILKDDKNKCVLTRKWWEPGARNDGFVWVRVFKERGET